MRKTGKEDGRDGRECRVYVEILGRATTMTQ